MYKLLADKPVVQKYGGTSLGSIERIDAIARRVADQLKAGYSQIAIVVSAMSGETNRLVELVQQANANANPAHYDMAVAAGEQVSVALLAASLEKYGVQARGFLAYQLGIRTDELHSKARIRSIECEALRRCWEKSIVPVIAGFQGVTDDDQITTLGRGGSDTSAVALAVALKAGFCEINTDVDGVFTADPRIVASARLCEQLDFEAALEMASLGSKVLHSRCVELAAKYKMPIVVRNSFSQNDHPRTRIMEVSQHEQLEAPVVSGVTVDKNVARITLNRLPGRHDTIADIFRTVAKHGINVDIIVHDTDMDRDRLRLGFTVGREDLTRCYELLDEWKAKVDSSIEIEKGLALAKVSVVGLGMRSHPGVASACFETLASESITLHMISTSEIKISCVVHEEDVTRAAQVLHRRFLEDRN